MCGRQRPQFTRGGRIEFGPPAVGFDAAGMDAVRMDAFPMERR